METERSLIGFWTIVIPSVSIKDQPLLIPLVMWTHASHLAGQISHSDREASGTIRAGIDPLGAHIGADGGMIGA
jgi:hypothetical protein